MTVKKWNYEAENYEPYEIPEKWFCPILLYNMKNIVNCASCGKKIEFGDTYTSRIIHNDYGMGYNVCPKCHEEELRNERKYNEGRYFEP